MIVPNNIRIVNRALLFPRRGLSEKEFDVLNLRVRDSKEEGTTTTPFDMVVLNDLDRFHWVEEVAPGEKDSHGSEEESHEDSGR